MPLPGQTLPENQCLVTKKEGENRNRMRKHGTDGRAVDVRVEVRAGGKTSRLHVAGEHQGRPPLCL